MGIADQDQLPDEDFVALQLRDQAWLGRGKHRLRSNGRMSRMRNRRFSPLTRRRIFWPNPRPYIAIGLFSGLRSAELQRLNGDAIKIEGDHRGCRCGEETIPVVWSKCVTLFWHGSNQCYRSMGQWWRHRSFGTTWMRLGKPVESKNGHTMHYVTRLAPTVSLITAIR